MNKTNVLQWLEEDAALRGDKTAVSDPSGSFTFAETLHHARAIGTLLSGLMRPGTGAAFCMEKSAEAVCAMFGAVYAGGFYSFIDVRQPAARAGRMLEKLGPAVLVTDEEHREAFLPAAEALGVPLLLIGELMDAEEEDGGRLLSIRRACLDTDVLYVNFTSGSTGVPKGVAVCHRSVIDFIGVFAETLGIGEGDVLANQAPFDFDVSVKDIYTGLLTGARVCLIPRDYFSQPARLMDYLADEEATVLVWAVSALLFVSIMNGLEYRRPGAIRMICFSGEVMPPKHLSKFREAYPEADFVNLYGPTEITCNCTYYRVPKDRAYGKDEVIPAGVPFANERVFLLDEEDRLVLPEETGRRGEIAVAGTCLALGYWRDPERTAEAFVLNPLRRDVPERIYRTGDLGFYDGEGLLVYAGRRDFQIKHLGHRIELGEIERCAERAEGAEQALCLYDGKRKKLVLFIRFPGEEGERDAVRERVLERIRSDLPPFMAPGKTLVLPDFPLNKNGKTDRAALAAMAGIGAE